MPVLCWPRLICWKVHSRRSTSKKSTWKRWWRHTAFGRVELSWLLSYCPSISFPFQISMVSILNLYEFQALISYSTRYAWVHYLKQHGAKLVRKLAILAVHRLSDACMVSQPKRKSQAHFRQFVLEIFRSHFVCPLLGSWTNMLHAWLLADPVDVDVYRHGDANAV